MQKQIKDYKDYLITTNGVVISCKKKKHIELKQYRVGRDKSRLGVCLFQKGLKKRRAKIHRLVAETFISNPDNKPQVNHKDGNTLNNKVENLEWCTNRENMNHAVKNKLMAYGVKSGRSKFKPKDIREIRQKYNYWKYSTYKLAKEYGVSQGAIFKIIKGINWKYLV